MHPTLFMGEMIKDSFAIGVPFGVPLLDWRIRDWEFRLSLSKSGVLNQKKEWGMGLGDENSPALLRRGSFLLFRDSFFCG